jgi:hypothetical protein
VLGHGSRVDHAEAVKVLSRAPKDEIGVGHQMAGDRPVQPTGLFLVSCQWCRASRARRPLAPSSRVLAGDAGQPIRGSQG